MSDMHTPPGASAPATASAPVAAEQAPFRPWALLIRVLIVLLAIGVVWVFASRWNIWTGEAVHQTTDDAYLESDVIPLSARVAGLVASVPVNDYQAVKKGDLLVQLVDSDYRAQVAQAKGALDQSLAQIAVLQKQRAQQGATIAAALAAVTSATAGAQLNRLEAGRQRGLLAQGHYASQQAVDQADAGEKQATAAQAQQIATSSATKRALDTIDAQLAAAQAAVTIQNAALTLATINLDYTHIRAPIDGVVGARGVRVGQFMAVGTQAITVVGLPKVWVIANYKETQMTHIHRNQSTEVTVDAFPGRTFPGHVDSWSPASGARFALLPPDNATGNFTKVIQRLAVKIVLDDSRDAEAIAALRPGMSVIATIDTAR